MIYDITTYEASLSSLSELTHRSEAKIMAYVMTHGQNAFTAGFLSELGISQSQLLETDIWCTALHVTSNNDECKSLEQHGLVGLQKAIMLDTPLKRYLEEHGVTIDLARQEISHRGIIYDVSKRSSDGCNYKLFTDFATSAFFSTHDALAYEGEVRRRPEFLVNLSRLLKWSAMEDDWEKSNKCYVVKFKAAMRDFQPCSFCPRETRWEGNEWEAIEKVIDRTLSTLHNWVSGQPLSVHYAFLQAGKIIPRSDILEIYTDVRYREAFGIA